MKRGVTLTKRGVATLVAMLAGLAATGTALSVPAHAQVGYPPGPCTATVNAATVGAVSVGATFTVVLTPVCAWAPGAPVTVFVNGQVVATKLVGLGGTVSVSVTVLSATTLSIDDPVLVPAVCGTNAVSGVGGSSVAVGMVTQTVSFHLDCGSLAAQTVSRGFLSFTGANVLRWAGVAGGAMLIGALLVGVTRKRAKASGSPDPAPPARSAPPRAAYRRRR